MKLVIIAAAASIAAATAAYAQGNTGTVTGNAPQTTQNGPNGGNPDANVIKANKESAATYKAKKRAKKKLSGSSDPATNTDG